MSSKPIEESSEQAATNSETPAALGVLEEIQLLWRALSELCQSQFLYAALETRLAGESLVAMLIAGVMIAVLLNGAWLGLVATLVFSLIENGLSVSYALLSATAVHLLLVLFLLRLIRYKSRNLQFPGLYRSLSVSKDANKT